MYVIKLLGSVLLSLSIFSAAAAAEMISQPVFNNESETVTISGQIPDCGYGGCVSITVLKPNTDGDETDYTAKSITDIINSGMLAAYAQYITDENGVYTAEFSLADSSSGDYTILLSNSQNDKTEKKVFYFASAQSKQDFINEIRETVTKAGASSADLALKLKIESVSDDTAKLFGIDGESIIFTVNSSGLSAVLFELLKNAEDISEMTPASFVEQLNLAAQLRSVTEGSVNITDYKEEFGLDEDFFSTYTDKISRSESRKSSFDSFFRDKDIYSVKSAQEMFCEGICISILSNPEGWSSYTSLIEAHGAYMKARGLNLDGYMALSNPSVVTDSLAAGYTSVESFISDVNKAVSKAAFSGTSNPLPSGGGGGGAGGGTGSTKRGNTSAAAIVNSIVSPPVTASEISVFEDISSVPWAEESIKELAARGIINGTGKNRFEPDGNVLREQFVKMAVLSFGISTDGAENTFTDVEDGQWYSSYIPAAVKAGIINGVGDGRFGTGQNVTRQDAAVILYRAARLSGMEFTADENTFADDGEIADYARDAVYALKAAAVINGQGDNAFCPNEVCSRAQAAKMIYELMKNIKEQ